MRFLASKNGTVHVIHAELDMSSCSVVTRAKNAGTWKGQRSLKPEEVLKKGDCLNCESHKLARQEIRRAKRSSTTVLKEDGILWPRKKKAPARAPRDVTPMAKGDNWPVADERTTLKVKQHVAIAEEHGWRVNVAQNTRRGLTLTATKGDEICVLAYRENGILWNDEIVFVVPGRRVPMHNSGTWRRQVSLPEGQRPIPARPKKFGRKPSPSVEINGVAKELVEESDEVTEEIPLNKSSLPFNKDDEDLIIIDYIKGRTLFWRNNMMAKVVSAGVPSKPTLIRFGETKHGRRFVSFPESTMTKDGEIWGAERSVAIDDMLRVR